MCRWCACKGLFFLLCKYEAKGQSTNQSYSFSLPRSGLFIIRLLRPRQGQPECNLSTGGNRVRDSRLRRTHKHDTCTCSHCHYITTTSTTVSRAGPGKIPPLSLRQVEKRSALISPPTSNHFLATLPSFFLLLPFAGCAGCFQLRHTSYPISADSLSSCALCGALWTLYNAVCRLCVDTV